MSQRDDIIKLLKEKSVMKQDVYRNTLATFELFKRIAQEIGSDLKKEAQAIDPRISVEYVQNSDYEIKLKVASDVLVFYMHTNVFEFDKTHPMHKTGYIKENENNSYCGIIYIYNFLADSFKYNRVNDLGYLIARVFVNRESRFFVESRPAMGYKYQNFSKEPITEEVVRDIINELVIYSISFDLYTPPNDAVKEISVYEIQERIQSDKFKTGKRLGFNVHSNTYMGENLSF
jgi:hypothetical protein